MGFAEREKSRSGHGVVASMLESPVSYEQREARPKGRPKEHRETKKRVSLAVLPSLYEDAKKIAYVERKSISEIVSDYLEKYVKDNAAKLEEYEKIKK